VSDHSRDAEDRVEDLDVPEQEADDVRGGLLPAVQADAFNPKEVSVDRFAKRGSPVKWELSELDT
jgi:hypothetical protein